MSMDENATARSKTLADLAANMLGSGVVEALSRVFEKIKSFAESIVERLSPMVEAVAKAARVIVSRATSNQLAFGRCFYEALLAFLEAVPGGRGVVRAIRTVVDPILYPDLRPFGLPAIAVAISTPASRVASPRRLVSCSTRSLRGPSAVLPHQSLEAALT